MSKDSTKETIRGILEGKHPYDDQLVRHFQHYLELKRAEEDADLARKFQDLRRAKREGGQAIRVARSHLHDHVVRATDLRGFKSPLINRKNENHGRQI